jgi:hypothetical protein
MDKRLILCIVGGVFVAHIAVVMIIYHVNNMLTPPPPPPPEPTFRAQKINYVDPKTNEVHSVEHRYTVSLDLIRAEDAAERKGEETAEPSQVGPSPTRP